MTKRRTSSASTSQDQWVADVEAEMEVFASTHSAVLGSTERVLAAYFEIGCFLSLVEDYEQQSVAVSVSNLTKEKAFRYLTTPSGNPDNFSHVVLERGSSRWQLRQQIRIVSHLHPDVALTPDLCVLDADADLLSARDTDFAHGKKGFFRVHSSAVVAAHECKCLTAFPELYASFVGLALVCHDWMETFGRGEARRYLTGHLAPALFVGGDASNLHRRMLRAIESVYPINIITGLHKTGLAWRKQRGTLSRLPLDGAWLD